MDIENLSFAPTVFRTGYDQQEVDTFLDHVAVSLALPLAERTFRAADVAGTSFTMTRFRAGYDIEEVDTALAAIGIELTLPSPSERGHAAYPQSPPPFQMTPTPAPDVVRRQPPAPVEPVDDFRPDPTF